MVTGVRIILHCTGGQSLTYIGVQFLEIYTFIFRTVQFALEILSAISFV
jgi:hypothetical protein